MILFGLVVISNPPPTADKEDELFTENSQMEASLLQVYAEADPEPTNFDLLAVTCREIRVMRCVIASVRAHAFG